jgi:von Willebrand factor type A domain.
MFPPDVRTDGGVCRRLWPPAKVKDRIGTAKEEIAKFIEARPNDRIGLIAFAPLPYVVCPPTLDHAWLIANLDRLESGSIGDATGIAGPVTSAVQRLKDSDSKRSIIVLFTDGANNVNAKVTPRQAAKLAKTFDITLYTVGIGSRNSVIKMDSMFGSGFQRIQGDFDDKLLQDMADSTGGVYYKAADGETMSKAMAQIDQLEKTSVEQNIFVNWKEYYPMFCYLAILFLMAGFLFEHAIRVSLP